MLTLEDKQKLNEIMRLLDEGLKHYLTYDSYAKSSEGWVEVAFDFNTSWYRFGNPVKPKMTVRVYSYVLGPHRNHYFDSIDEALDAVREWHAAEMSFDPHAEDANMKVLQNIFEDKPVKKGRVS